MAIVSYMAQTVRGPSPEWRTNSIRFLTRTEAEAYAGQMAWKEDKVRQVRVVPINEPPTHRWDFRLRECFPLDTDDLGC